jgi:type II secretory pathway pseudopilin PulG
MMGMRHARQKTGHTLVEILMVVAIIAMFVYVPLTRYDTHRKQTAARVTKANIENIRMAISLYYEQEGVWPSSNLSNLVSGSPSGTQYIAKIPQEGSTGLSTVVNSATNTGGWVWNTSTHKVLPNLTGADAFGVSYDTY